MAIAALVLHTESACLQELLRLLQGRPAVLEAQKATDTKIAATVELEAAQLPLELKKIRDLEPVLELELVYVNYEEDAESEAGIGCPPLATILGKTR